jgi:hypothetical protein
LATPTLVDAEVIPAMKYASTVDERASGREMEVVSAKWPKERKALLRAVQARKGHRELSQTVREALDRYVEQELGVTLARP